MPESVRLWIMTPKNRVEELTNFRAAYAEMNPRPVPVFGPIENPAEN
jgi:hypothetical protein